MNGEVAGNRAADHGDARVAGAARGEQQPGGHFQRTTRMFKIRAANLAAVGEASGRKKTGVSV